MDLQSKTLSIEDWFDISIKLDNKLKLIHSVESDNYTSNIQNTSAPYYEIMYNKVLQQCYDKQNIFVDKIDVNKLLISIKSILVKSHYSKPTLVHMDIKPANIILSPDKNVYLIDFELSRFADLDYEWANILIKSLHAYDERFKHYVLNPIINKNFMSLDKALMIDKLKVYLLYLAINKYLYCLKRNVLCPQPIIDLAYKLVIILNKN